MDAHYLRAVRFKVKLESAKDVIQPAAERESENYWTLIGGKYWTLIDTVNQH